MRKPDIKIESSIHSREYENQRHLEFGPDIPKAKPVADPERYIAAIARGINEVILGIRSVDQFASVLNEHVYESLRRRSTARAQLRMKEGRVPNIQPTDVLRVKFQSPADGVIESVVLLTTKHRAKAITIRLEGHYGSWKATNIGFI